MYQLHILLVFPIEQSDSFAQLVPVENAWNNLKLLLFHQIVSPVFSKNCSLIKKQNVSLQQTNY